MKVEGVAVKVAPSLLSGGGSIRWWRSLRLPTTGYRGVPPWGMVAEAVAYGGGVRCAHRPPVIEV